ncbi:hypothetical protein [Herbaspirillum rubrisubalbicans]|uniref:Uncharacterized protein n=1 Tax=Herbaspirillum rubrisubalbicans TaxID=80842 RepID=A0AAD0U648_9BURK|nr:hypothetical protein [Herbaspirillum rubrisubalbicans]AYR23011.1 hypothetical protein RC54_03890 [Herbaspirillum rubrisubalbicans]
MRTKQTVPEDVRRRVLELRHTCSLQEVSRHTGVPLGTVKTICSRSGVFRDNPKHRALFALPPIVESESRQLAVPTMPPQEKVTGDKEIDAVLWLQQVVATGQADLIAKAMEALKKIKTPMAILEKRYRDFVMRKNPGNLFALLPTIGFGKLNDQAERAVSRNASAQEAIARFGSEDACFISTPAEEFIIALLKEVDFIGEDDFGLPQLTDEVKTCFQQVSDYLPHTLSDCLHELRYWNDLYRLRHALDPNCGDSIHEEWVRRDFIFHLMATIRPKDRDEAATVMRFMFDDDDGNHMDKKEARDILLNLVG